MELMIFDKYINYLGILEHQFSFRRVRRYSKCGDFELHVNFDIKLMRMLDKDNIVWISGDIQAGIINHRQIKVDVDGKEILVVSGKFITSLLGRRIIWETENINTTNELAIRQLVNSNAINPNNLDRKIPLMEFGEINNYTGNIEYQVSYKNLLEEIEKIALNSELGIRTRFDVKNKKFIFEVYKGIDRSIEAKFSQDAENILSQEYADSVDNYKNAALVAGEGEGDLRQKISIGNSAGFDRYEEFVDAKDIKKETLSNIQYEELLKSKGHIKLSEMTEIKTFDSTVDLNADLKYKVDYDVGDIVTCINNKWGVVMQARITEIEEIYEEANMKVNIIFGNKIPTILDKIRQVVK